MDAQYSGLTFDVLYPPCRFHSRKITAVAPAGERVFVAFDDGALVSVQLREPRGGGSSDNSAEQAELYQCQILTVFPTLSPLPPVGYSRRSRLPCPLLRRPAGFALRPHHDFFYPRPRMAIQDPRRARSAAIVSCTPSRSACCVGIVSRVSSGAAVHVRFVGNLLS